MTRTFTKLKIQHKKDDAYFDIYISDDLMTAKADFFPARGKGRPFTKESIDLILSKSKLCYGIEYKTIDDAADECNGSKNSVHDVVIARGFIPVEDSPAYFKINSAYQKPSVPKELSGGKVDYRSVSPFVMVKAGDELARLVPASAGHNGKTVTGNETPFPKAARKELIEGEGIYIKDDCIFAKEPGLLKIEGNTISVENTLRLHNVGYHTGNIDFTGNLVLEGSISDGFKVHAGGNINALDTFTVSDCLSRGSLTARRGIVGRGSGMVKVSGSLRARFVRGCKIACKGNVYIEKEIIGGTIWTMGTLDISRGVLAAASVHAFRGINAGKIGTKTARPARIFLGDDWIRAPAIQKDAEKLKKLKYNIESLNDIITRYKQGLLTEKTIPVLQHISRGLKVFVYANEPAVITNFVKRRDIFIAEYKALYARYKESVKQKQTNYAAALTVHGVITAGTYIEICSVPYHIADNMQNVRFALDKNTKKVMVEKN